jgi:membrane-associated phospholipid phosphatase
VWIALHHVGANFPSGVVTFVTGAGGYVAAVARRQGRTIALGAVIVVIVGAGPARVLGGQHLLSDALGGYLLGAAWLIPAVIYMAGSSLAPAEKPEGHELVLSTA